MIPAELRAFDPLLRPSKRGLSKYVLAAIAVHALVLAALWLHDAVFPRHFAPAPKRAPSRVTIIDAPVKEEPPAPPVIEEPVTPRRVVRDKTEARVVETAKVEEPAPNAPVERIVGISFESTVSGGSGPAVAVGNTLAAPATPVARTPTAAVNRVARAAGVVRPERTRVRKPDYPAEYRAQGLEADVEVEIEIDVTGHVNKARVLKPSPHVEFNRAALAAAKEEVFSPAMDGERPVPFTLSFTYRFRLQELR